MRYCGFICNLFVFTFIPWALSFSVDSIPEIGVEPINLNFTEPSLNLDLCSLELDLYYLIHIK